MPQLTLPVQVVTDPEGGGGLVYKGSNYGDVEFPAESQDLASIEQLLGIGPTTDSMTGKPLPPPASVSVSVLNGTGVYNQATDTGTALTALGYHLVGLGDTNPVGDVSETYVYYGSRDVSDRGRGGIGRPFDGRCRHHGVRPCRGGRRRTGHRGHRLTVRGQHPKFASVGDRHGHQRLDVTEHDDIDDLRARRIRLGRRCDCGSEFSHHPARTVGPASVRTRRGSGCTDPQSDLTCPPPPADSNRDRKVRTVTLPYPLRSSPAPPPGGCSRLHHVGDHHHDAAGRSTSALVEASVTIGKEVYNLQDEFECYLNFAGNDVGPPAFGGTGTNAGVDFANISWQTIPAGDFYGSPTATVNARPNAVPTRFRQPRPVTMIAVQ